MSFMTILRRSLSGESVLFLAWKTNDSKYSLGIPDDHTKRRQDVPHFSLKYLCNDGINGGLVYCENFLKIYTFRPAKKIIALISSGVYL